jgi:hypothetical protein
VVAVKMRHEDRVNAVRIDPEFSHGDKTGGATIDQKGAAVIVTKACIRPNPPLPKASRKPRIGRPFGKPPDLVALIGGFTS